MTAATTFTLDDASAGRGFDRVIALARQQRIANEEHQTARAMRVAMLAEAFEDGMSDDVRAPALFASCSNPIRRKSVAGVFVDAIDTEGLRVALAELVADAAMGLPVQDKAVSLIKQAKVRFADSECDL